MIADTTDRTPRTQIMDAAVRAFAEHGYHGVSMRALAKNVRRAPATFYSHFASKEDLLFAMQTCAFDRLLGGGLDAVRQSRTGADRLRAFIGRHVDFVVANPELMRVLIYEASALPRRRREQVKQRKREYFELARSVVKQTLDDSDVAGDSTDPVAVDRLTYCLFGMLNWTFAWYAAGEHGSPDDLATTIHRTLLHGVRTPPSTTARAPRHARESRPR